MRPRTLLVLFLLVAGLGAFVWFYERDLPGTDERSERAQQLLPDFDADWVDGLTLTTEKGTVVLAREEASGEGGGEDAAWRITSPLEARADGAAVSAMLSTLDGLQKKRSLEGVTAQEAGLAEPRARLEVRSADGEAVLSIGSSVPASGDVLVALGDGPPYFVTGSGIVDQIDRTPGEWRDRDLFPWQRAEVERLRIESAGGELLLARRGDDYWVEEPYTDRADAEGVSRLFGALTGLRAESFIDEPTEDAGLNEPQVAIEAVIEGREDPFSVRLGAAIDGEPPRRYARVGDQTVEVVDELFGAAAGDPERWRSLQWASLDAFEIDRVEATRGDETLSLDRSGGDWTRDGEPIAFGAASDLLYAVTGAKAQELDRGELVGEPEMRIVLESAERAETLEVFPPEGERYPATVGGRAVVLWLDGATVRDIGEKWLVVRDERRVEDDSEVDDEPEGDGEVETNSSS